MTVNEIEEIFEWIDNPQTSTHEVRCRLRELEVQEPCPPDDELLFFKVDLGLFWQHVIEQNTFKGCQIWTNGEIIAVRVENRDCIEQILTILNGIIVEEKDA